jgi:hypothetical protein
VRCGLRAWDQCQPGRVPLEPERRHSQKVSCRAHCEGRWMQLCWQGGRADWAAVLALALPFRRARERVRTRTHAMLAAMNRPTACREGDAREHHGCRMRHSPSRARECFQLEWRSRSRHRPQRHVAWKMQRPKANSCVRSEVPRVGRTRGDRRMRGGSTAVHSQNERRATARAVHLAQHSSMCKSHTVANTACACGSPARFGRPTAHAPLRA